MESDAAKITRLEADLLTCQQIISRAAEQYDNLHQRYLSLFQRHEEMQTRIALAMSDGV